MKSYKRRILRSSTGIPRSDGVAASELFQDVVEEVLATQQPSRRTISGNIQTNLPCRVELALGSSIESNMILNCSGAERLTGAGDLLYKDFGDPVRLQAPYLPEDERRRWLRA